MYPNYELKFETSLANIILDVFNDNNGIYGANRITIVLNKTYNIKISQKKVYRYMCLLNLKSFVRKKKRVRKPREIKVINTKFKNEVKRLWNNYEKGELASTDVSYLTYANKSKFAYLSIIKDAKTGLIIGHVVSQRNDNKIYLNTLKVSENYRDFSKKIIIHSDNGFQYTSRIVQKYCEDNNIIISLSRPGNSIDNAQSETFFACLKTEWLLNKNFNTFEEIKKYVDEYINYYNFKRIRIKTKSTPWEAWSIY